MEKCDVITDVILGLLLIRYTRNYLSSVFSLLNELDSSHVSSEHGFKDSWSVFLFLSFIFGRIGTKHVFIVMSAKWYSLQITLSATRRGHTALCK